jgi:parallel beta-helix repeat protein
VKRRSIISIALTSTLFLPACGDSSGETDSDSTEDGTDESSSETAADETGSAQDFPNCSCADDYTGDGNCFEVASGDSEGLLVAANSLEDGDMLVVGLGVYELDNQVTIRGDNITVCGQGKGVEGSMDEGTILDFQSQTTQGNGIDAVGDYYTVRDIAVIDAKKDGFRIEDSDWVTIQRVRATWRNENDSENGAYGIYPVKVQHVLMEDSEAYNTADAGIYVGQCQHAVVRNNIAMKNVAGIEIENTQFADVYGNHAEDNTGGLVIFDLPGNPVVGRDVRIHDNMVINNNRTNFAPGGTVRQIPVGTGTFAMASRRVEIDNNTYENNGTFDIALVSGLIIEGNEDSWVLSVDELVGDVSDLNLQTEGDQVWNFRSDNIHVHDNTHSGSGMDPLNSTSAQELGLLLAIVYGTTPIDALLYDAIGESMHSPTDPAMNSNDNHMCFGNSPGATFGSLNIENLLEGNKTVDDIYRPDAPFAPFDCDNFEAGPIIPPDMEY